MRLRPNYFYGKSNFLGIEIYENNNYNTLKNTKADIGEICDLLPLL